jgi:hypothetical protein
MSGSIDGFIPKGDVQERHRTVVREPASTIRVRTP